MRAPELSATRPLMLPLNSCACAAPIRTAVRSNQKNAERNNIFLIASSLLLEPFLPQLIGSNLFKRKSICARLYPGSPGDFKEILAGLQWFAMCEAGQYRLFKLQMLKYKTCDNICFEGATNGQGTRGQEKIFE